MDSQNVRDTNPLSPATSALEKMWNDTMNAAFEMDSENVRDTNPSSPTSSTTSALEKNWNDAMNAIEMLESDVASVFEPTQPVALPTQVIPEHQSPEPIEQQQHGSRKDSEDLFAESDVSVIEGTPVVLRKKKPNRASKRGSVGDVDELTKRKSLRLTDPIQHQSQDASSSSNGQQPRTTVQPNDSSDWSDSDLEPLQLQSRPAAADKTPIPLQDSDEDQQISDEILRQIQEMTHPVRVIVKRQSIAEPPAIPHRTSHPTEIPILQRRTRAKADALYDDEDEKQNELIGKEAGYANSTNKPKESELSRFELFRVECQLSKLPAPLPFEVFDKKDWNYVTTFDKELLAPDESFLSVHALAEIPRRHGRFPYCHPGPVVDTVSGTEDWYYADSIVQEVKLVRRIQPHYIVRWIGYEDSYNTVEPQSNLVGTAVLILHQKRNHFIGAGASGPTVLRRSTRIMAKRFEQVQVPHHNGNEQVSKCRELQLLESQLEREERADRYSPAIGFATLTSLPYTLQTQFEFIEKVFFSIIDESNTPGYVLGKSYFGSHGSNRSVDLTKSFPKTVKSANTMHTELKKAFAKANPKDDEPSYASFLVLVTHGSSAKATDKRIGFHMCVYTVRRFNKIYDSVYYDPSPECYRHAIPDRILEFKKIANRSSTLVYGPNTNKEDCVYQCMKYIIELHTGQVPFQCNLNSKNFKIKK